MRIAAVCLGTIVLFGVSVAQAALRLPTRS